MLAFDQFDSKITEATENLKNELQTIRTGRANPALVESIKAEAYGQKTPINQIANITVVDATLIRIQPWDKTLVGEIEKAIKESSLSVDSAVEGDGVKLVFPPLTEERREEYVKLMGEKVEEARIRIRVVRKDAILWIKEQKMSEEEQKSKEKQIQEKVDKANEEIESIREAKEKELMTV